MPVTPDQIRSFVDRKRSRRTDEHARLHAAAAADAARIVICRGVDAVFFSDDWGCQRGLLMNPHDWRRFYRLSYQRMFERVRSGGAHVWMHLCGNVAAILPDLIDIGLNVLNPVQPQAMDVR